MKVQHVRYESLDIGDDMTPAYLVRFGANRQVYVGEGFFDLQLGHHRWRWFW